MDSLAVEAGAPPPPPAGKMQPAVADKQKKETKEKKSTKEGNLGKKGGTNTRGRPAAGIKQWNNNAHPKVKALIEQLKLKGRQTSPGSIFWVAMNRSLDFRLWPGKKEGDPSWCPEWTLGGCHKNSAALCMISQRRRLNLSIGYATRSNQGWTHCWQTQQIGNHQIPPEANQGSAGSRR